MLRKETQAIAFDAAKRATALFAAIVTALTGIFAIRNTFSDPNESKLSGALESAIRATKDELSRLNADAVSLTDQFAAICDLNNEWAPEKRIAKCDELVESIVVGYPTMIPPKYLPGLLVAREGLRDARAHQREKSVQDEFFEKLRDNSGVIDAAIGGWAPLTSAIDTFLAHAELVKSRETTNDSLDSDLSAVWDAFQERMQRRDGDVEPTSLYQLCKNVKTRSDELDNWRLERQSPYYTATIGLGLLVATASLLFIVAPRRREQRKDIADPEIGAPAMAPSSPTPPIDLSEPELPRDGTSIFTALASFALVQSAALTAVARGEDRKWTVIGIYAIVVLCTVIWLAWNLFSKTKAGLAFRYDDTSRHYGRQVLIWNLVLAGIMVLLAAQNLLPNQTPRVAYLAAHIDVEPSFMPKKTDDFFTALPTDVVDKRNLSSVFRFLESLETNAIAEHLRTNPQPLTRRLVWLEQKSPFQASYKPVALELSMGSKDFTIGDRAAFLIGPAKPHGTASIRPMLFRTSNGRYTNIVDLQDPSPGEYFVLLLWIDGSAKGGDLSKVEAEKLKLRVELR